MKFVLDADSQIRRKRTAREAHKASADTQKMFGHKAKLHHAKRHSEKVQLKKTLKAHDERNVKQKDDGAVKEGALPTYLLDREGQKVGLFKIWHYNRPLKPVYTGRESSFVCHQR